MSFYLWLLFASDHQETVFCRSCLSLRYKNDIFIPVFFFLQSFGLTRCRIWLWTVMIWRRIKWAAEAIALCFCPLISCSLYYHCSVFYFFRPCVRSAWTDWRTWFSCAATELARCAGIGCQSAPSAGKRSREESCSTRKCLTKKYNTNLLLPIRISFFMMTLLYHFLPKLVWKIWWKLEPIAIMTLERKEQTSYYAREKKSRHQSLMPIEPLRHSIRF